MACLPWVGREQIGAKDDQRCQWEEQTEAHKERTLRSNENKMSDGGRERALIGAEAWNSFQQWSARRSAVRSIAWLDGLRGFMTSVRIVPRNSADNRAASRGLC
jgi:hypothetical protein